MHRSSYPRLPGRPRSLTAAMRKLLTILNAILKSRNPWKHA
jgi:hypothetical protein